MNNNFFPQYPGNQQMQPTYGYNYQQQQLPAFNNLISEEQAKMIANEGNGLNIARTPIEMARALCTHKHPNRGAAITQRSDGLWQCSICGTVMNILDMTTEEVTDVVATLTDIIHNIKLFIPNINPEIGRNLYQALDLVEVIPSLWDYATEYKNKYFNVAGSNSFTQNYGQNTINQLYALTNPTQFGMGGYGMMGAQPMQQQNGYFGQPMQQQPMGGMPASQPGMMGAQPMQQPQNGYFGQPMQQQPMGGMPASQPGMMGAQPMGMNMPQPGMFSNPVANTAPAQPITGGVVNPNDRPVGVVAPMVQQTGVATAGPAPQPAPAEKVQKNFKS